MGGGDTDAGGDAGTDAGLDCGDAGCPSSVFNGNGCGNRCSDAGATSVSFGGARCAHTCVSDRLDCNANNGLNLDGCECRGSICCSTACEPTHSYCIGTVRAALGADRNFHAGSCLALGVYSQSLAQAAAACASSTPGPVFAALPPTQRGSRTDMGGPPLSHRRGALGD